MNRSRKKSAEPGFFLGFAPEPVGYHVTNRTLAEQPWNANSHGMQSMISWSE